MCERKSVQQEQLSHLLQQKQQRIQLLSQQVNSLSTQISQKNKQIQSLSQLQINTKKIPYNIYKEFIINTQSDGSVVNLIKKRSLENQSQITFGQNSIKLSDPGNKYNQYLLIKIKGDKPPLYVSANTQISTLQKLNLNKYNKQQRESYSYISPDLQIKLSNKNNSNLKIQRKVIEYQLCENSKVKKAELNEQHKKLLMFPPNSALQLKRKQSLPLKTQCQILSDDLRKLKQKINTYTKILEQKSLNLLPTSLKSINGQITFKQNHITDFIESKMKQVSPIDFQGLQKSQWQKQKQQYIDYISNLQKEIRKLKNQQSYQSVKDKSYIQKTPNQSELKSPRLFESTPYSQLRTINNDQKYQIMKSDAESVNKSYFKNQYHVNDQDKSRSKSKGSKIIYLRRN